MAKWLSLVGLSLCLVGTWFVAFEVVRRFKGYSHEIKSMTYRGQGVVEKTKAFERWELRRAVFMWAGLALLTVGTALQIAALFANS